jgi:hypothetical protein
VRSGSGPSCSTARARTASSPSRESRWSGGTSSRSPSRAASRCGARFRPRTSPGSSRAWSK